MHHLRNKSVYCCNIQHETGIQKWTDDELKNMDKKIRTSQTIHGAHHPRTRIDRLYVEKVER